MTETLTLDFTGPASHRLRLEPGKGNLVVGPAGKVDLEVAPGDAVDWSVFDGMTTPAGGLWPRWIGYTGDDTSIFAWAEGRPVEELDVAPVSDVTIDATRSQIGRLVLRTVGARLDVALPATRYLNVHGDPALLTLRPHPSGPPPLVMYTLPGEVCGFPADPGPLREITAISVTKDPLAPPFDVRSLAGFPALREVLLCGAVTHLEALADHDLEALELRFAPDLSDLPDLATWPQLGRFIAWNVDRAAGPALRRQLKALPPLPGHRSVSQLRSPRWFVEEHGLPFAGWPSRSARSASAAYKKAAATIAKGGEPQLAVEAFVARINALPAIETAERDDTGEAVVLLARHSDGRLTEEDAVAWFDAVRDF